MSKLAASRLFVLSAMATFPAVAAEPPAEIAAPGMTVALAVHAVGAQIYACTAKSDGPLQWTFREPIAALIVDGKTIGRHFAGPSWQLDDGSLVKGKVAASAPGDSADDVALLKLTVIAPATEGALKGVTIVQRLETRGGGKSGACETRGALFAAPYSAEYIFLKP
jgi:hypothetical protein